jgi:hypothetical protein
MLARLSESSTTTRLIRSLQTLQRRADGRGSRTASSKQRPKAAATKPAAMHVCRPKALLGLDDVEVAAALPVGAEAGVAEELLAA